MSPNFHPPLFWFYRTDQKLIGVRPEISPKDFGLVLEVAQRLGYAVVHHCKNEQPLT